MSKILYFFIFIFILMIHRYVLSNKKIALLGAIVPLIYITIIITSIYHSNKHLGIFDYAPFFLGLLLLLAFWIRGREEYHNKK